MDLCKLCANEFAGNFSFEPPENAANVLNLLFELYQIDLTGVINQNQWVCETCLSKLTIISHILGTWQEAQPRAQPLSPEQILVIDEDDDTDVGYIIENNNNEDPNVNQNNKPMVEEKEEAEVTSSGCMSYVVDDDDAIISKVTITPPSPKYIIKCAYCGWATNRYNALSLHSKLHQHRDYICSSCGQTFDSSDKVQLHQISEHPELMDVPKSLSFMCTKCFRFFTNVGLLRKHIFNMHNGLKKLQSHNCVICNIEFLYIFELRAHERRHSKMIVSNNEIQKIFQLSNAEKEGKFECTICLSRFYSKACLSEHLLSKHNAMPKLPTLNIEEEVMIPDNESTNVSEEDSMMSIETPTEEEGELANLSSISSDYFAFLLAHDGAIIAKLPRSSRSREKLLKCANCEMKANRFKLLKHSVIHQHREYLCREYQCRLIFNTSEELQLHQSSRHPEHKKPLIITYWCVECGDCFKTFTHAHQHNRRVHRQMNTKIIANKCNTNFKYITELQNHKCNNQTMADYQYNDQERNTLEIKEESPVDLEEGMLVIPSYNHNQYSSESSITNEENQTFTENSTNIIDNEENSMMELEIQSLMEVEMQKEERKSSNSSDYFTFIIGQDGVIMAKVTTAERMEKWRKCAYCNVRVNPWDLLEHSTNHKDREYLCLEYQCGVVFNSLAKLQQHQSTQHWDYRPPDCIQYWCVECGKCLKSYTTALQHERQVHSGKTASHEFEKCNNKIKFITELQNHVGSNQATEGDGNELLENHKKSKLKEKPPMEYVDNDDDDNFVSKNNTNIMNKENQTDSKNINEENSIMEIQTKPMDKEEVVVKKSSTSSDYLTYILGLDGCILSKVAKVDRWEKWRKCAYCELKLPLVTLLKHSLRTHRDRQYLCREYQCGKMFNTSDSLQLHRTTQHTICRTPNYIQYWCVDCGRYYTTFSTVRYHELRVHRGLRNNTKLHKCRRCNNEFRTVDALRNHNYDCINQTFQCHFCKLQLATMDNLKNHIQLVHLTFNNNNNNNNNNSEGMISLNIISETDDPQYQLTYK